MSGSQPTSRNPSLDLAATIKDPSSESGSLPEAVPAERYALGGELGKGSTGTVFDATDVVLGRPVALKRLNGTDEESRRSFVREARVSASLDHPNIVPVYDLQSRPGTPSFLIMRRITGGSLGEAINRAREGLVSEELSSVAATVAVFIKVSEALARAHSRGIVHRDIKPDNIMVGEHGEVLVADWGEALVLRDGTNSGRAGTVGTPVYMSPEQARGESVTPASDVYAVAGSLLHALTRRPPLSDADPATFWMRRRSGDIDWLTEAENSRIGRQLSAVLTKALSETPEGRYRDAGELAAELRRYQQGLSLSAYKPALAERALSYLIRHGWRLTAAAIVCLLMATAAWYVYGERMRQVAQWGLPMESGGLTSPDWGQQWKEVVPGSWKIANGVAVSLSDTASYLTFEPLLSARTAIEYTGMMDPVSPPGDLSVRWMEETSTGAAQTGWMIQAGAYQNQYCAIHRMPSYERVAYSPFQLTPGKAHKFRVEIDGRRITMSIDGETIVAHEAEVSVQAGHLSLYAFHAGKSFSDIRIYQKNPAELVSVLSVGEALFTDGRLDAARRSWAQVASAHPGSDLANQARYLEGLAALRSGREKDALDAWSRLTPGTWDDKAELQRLDLEWKNGWSPEIGDRLDRLLRRSPVLAQSVSNLWQRWVRTCYHPPLERSERYLAELISLRSRILQNDRSSAQQAGFAYLRLGQSIEGLGDPSIVGPDRAWLLIRAGRAKEVAEDPHALLEARALALVDIGQPERALALPGLSPEKRNGLLDLLGRSPEFVRALADPAAAALLARQQDEAELVLTSDSNRRAALLYNLGRWNDSSQPPSMASLYRSGRYAEARGIDWSIESRLQSTWLESIETGNNLISATAAVKDRKNIDRWFLPLFALPLLDHLAGDDEAWRNALARAKQIEYQFSGIPRDLARYLLGEIDSTELLAMPVRRAGPACLAIGRALKAEIGREHTAAIAGWQAFLDLPPMLRAIEDNQLSPLIERFAYLRTRQ